MIKAPVQKVWDIMLSDEGYRKWTSAFNPAGSRYEGDRSQGSKIRFLGPNPMDTTKIGGMYSEIAENKPYEFISIRHLGEVNGTEVNEVSERKGALENYTFSEENGVTTVTVDTDMMEEYENDMNQARIQALAVLKNFCETQ